MKTISKVQCIIVGIFDNAWDMDQAVERLAAAGFDDTVYDEAIVKEEPGSLDPAVPTLAPRLVLGSDEPNLLPKRDKHTIARGFKAHLADYHLPHEVIEAYATTFYHGGKFVLVKTDAERAEQVMKMLQGCGATRVDRHE
jgi:hypothetical protein